MPLVEELEASGQRLFRQRSYWPFAFLPVAVAALPHGEAVELALGAKADFLYEGACLLISLTGLAIRCATIGFAPQGTSGRNTHGQVALTLNSDGMYSVVRHPLYLGNFLIFFGVVLFTQVWWLPICAAAFFALYYERIMLAEEQYLHSRFGEHFQQWAARTPAFVPKPALWKAPKLPFAWRHALKREYTAMLSVVASFSLSEFLGDRLVYGRWQVQAEWVAFLLAGCCLYLLLRTIKRKTSWLEVVGR